MADIAVNIITSTATAAATTIDSPIEASPVLPLASPVLMSADAEKSAPEASTSVRPAPNTVRLLTYNVYLRPPGIKSNKGDFKNERIDHFIKHQLNNYDVVCFQECFSFGSGRQDRVLDAARAMGLEYAQHSQHKCFCELSIDGGLVVLSRFPIITSALTTYPRGKDSDWLASKGAIYVRLQLEGDNVLHLFTTHTQASYSLVVPIMDASAQIRLKQFYQLRRFIDKCLETAKPTERVVLCGDFNVDGRHPDKALADLPGNSSDEYLAVVDILSGKGVDAKYVEGTKKTQGEFEYVSDAMYKVTDVVYEAYGQRHPVTFADVKTKEDEEKEVLPGLGEPLVGEDGKMTPRETVLTDPQLLCTRERLDYIMVLEPLRQGETAPDETTKVDVVLEQSHVEPFFVPDTPFGQLSDHYGMSTKLKLTLT
jgi:endonuclease/exonuclease/phosphatase family metal-dependent hydrolase